MSKKKGLDTKDNRALVTLTDGREVWRDGEGRFRDKSTGQYVTVQEKDLRPALAVVPEEPAPPDSREAAREHLLHIVREGGYTASDPADAWGVLVGVQAEIALEAGKGKQAIDAFKLVAQATGLMPAKPQAEETSPTARLELGPDLVRKLLLVLAAEAVHSS